MIIEEFEKSFWKTSNSLKSTRLIPFLGNSSILFNDHCDQKSSDHFESSQQKPKRKISVESFCHNGTE